MSLTPRKTNVINIPRTIHRHIAPIPREWGGVNLCRGKGGGRHVEVFRRVLNMVRHFSKWPMNRGGGVEISPNITKGGGQTNPPQGVWKQKTRSIWESR